jgi:hypothetical protein
LLLVDLAVGYIRIDDEETNPRRNVMTLVPRFAQGFGAIYLVVGVAGFIPPLLAAKQPDSSFMGLLLGLFFINALHSATHLLIGVAGTRGDGVLAWAGFASSIKLTAIGTLTNSPRGGPCFLAAFV